MAPRRCRLLAALAVACATALAGCSIGPDPGGSGATLTVTRDAGAKRLLHASTPDLPGGETVMRFLQRRADVDTRYGGRFAQSIEGLESGFGSGQREDWFYWVNGIEGEKSAAEQRVEDGDRIWWDYRDWSAAMRVPTVVGSYPEPFLHGSDGKRYPVRIDCADDAESVCRAVADRLETAGVNASTTAIGAPAGEAVLRLVVGEWSDVRRDSAARRIEIGPSTSGVFARFAVSGDRPELLLLDRLGRVTRRLSTGAGLVAATRFQEQQPTWVVTGVDRSGLLEASRLLVERTLRDRFAVATDGRDALALPLRSAQR